MLSVLFSSTCYSSNEHIDPQNFFLACGELVKAKKSFPFTDRSGVTRNYRLTSSLLTSESKSNIAKILEYIEISDLQINKKETAYILGTAYRETAGAMKPVAEKQHCKNAKCGYPSYGKPLKNGKSYYGRGYVQLTKDNNYKKLGKVLDLDPSTALYDNPELALENDMAIRILVNGMYRGSFTGKKLLDYFEDNENLWDDKKGTDARDIVNPGSPHAGITNGYAKLIYSCLR